MNWISVKERLPETKDMYLVYEYGIHIMWYDGKAFHGDPAHWMPLPEPPRESTQEHPHQWCHEPAGTCNDPVCYECGAHWNDLPEPPRE